MEIHNLIKSAGFIEFINKLDNLINELLYSEKDGFVNLLSRNALNSAKNVLEKFNYEADKLSKEYSYSNSNEIIKNKRQDLTLIIKKHCEKQSVVWALEVFEETIENCLLKASLNSDNSDILAKIYGDIKDAVLWITDIKGYSVNEKEKLFKEVMNKFNTAIKSNDSDYISFSNPDKSDCKLYLDIFDMIISDYEKFLNTNLDMYKAKLSNDDLIYFQRIQSELRQNKTKTLDRINLINYALKNLNNKKANDKYNFLIQIKESLANLEDNSDENIVKTLKQRLSIFENKDRYMSELFGF